MRNLPLIVLLSGFLGACVATPTAIPPSATPAGIERLVPEVLAVYPHDPGAFTQGLVWHDGVFYESAGLYGQSSLRRVEIQTGTVLQQVTVEARYFAEGLALVGDRLIQITWRERTALVYDLTTLTPVSTFTYDTEGWGLCYDGSALYMSDGSSILYQRDPQSFAVTAIYQVTQDGAPVALLNELECVGDIVYANVWYSDTIVRIDKASGRVMGVIDASGLLTPEQRAGLGSDAVLNGIAYNPETDTFYVTGKLWSSVFEVRFVAP